MLARASFNRVPEWTTAQSTEPIPISGAPRSRPRHPEWIKAPGRLTSPTRYRVRVDSRRPRTARLPCQPMRAARQRPLAAWSVVPRAPIGPLVRHREWPHRRPAPTARIRVVRRDQEPLLLVVRSRPRGGTRAEDSRQLVPRYHAVRAESPITT